MIIDIHTHIAYEPIYPRSYLDGMIEEVSFSQKEKVYKAFLNDKYCKRMIKQMDEAHIDKSVLLIIDGGIGLEEPKLSLEDIYLLHNKVLEGNKDRFIVFAGIDPRRGQVGLDLFEKSITSYGFQGLKLYPPMGYAMNAKELYNYYDICSQYKLPVLIHTGDSLPNMQNEFGKPDCIFDLANSYPSVNFILAHAGYCLRSLSDKRVLNLPNVFFDIAGFQSAYKVVDDNAIINLGVIFSKDYNEKVLFGTDWPLFNMTNPIKNNVSFISKLYEVVQDKTLGALDNIFYKNAQRALNI